MRMLEHVAYCRFTFQIFCAKAWTRSKFGNIDDFDGELVTCRPMNASSNHTERTSEKKKKKKRISA
ncbi:hypothetical protein X975_01838, partial [Stegodyphus mimosarum]